MREQWELCRSKAGISVESQPQQLFLSLQHLPQALRYISSFRCSKPGNTPAPFYGHSSCVMRSQHKPMAGLGTKSVSAPSNCLRLASPFSFRLDVGIQVPTSSGLSWKNPSSHSHTQPSELQDTHIFLSFFQFCFLFLHSHDKHLPHFILLLLEFTQELVPLCFVSLLETVKTQKKKNKESELCFMQSHEFPAFGDLTASSFHKTSPEVPAVQARHEPLPRNLSYLFRWQQQGWQQGYKPASKTEHTVQDPVNHSAGRIPVLQNIQPLHKEPLVLAQLVTCLIHTFLLLHAVCLESLHLKCKVCGAETGIAKSKIWLYAVH